MLTNWYGVTDSARVGRLHIHYIDVFRGCMPYPWLMTLMRDRYTGAIELQLNHQLARRTPAEAAQTGRALLQVLDGLVCRPEDTLRSVIAPLAALPP